MAARTSSTRPVQEVSVLVGPFTLSAGLDADATSREAAKIAKGSGWGRYTDFAVFCAPSRELMGCQVKY